MAELAEPVFNRDPLSLDVVADLPGFYRELRAHHPVYYYPDYDTFFFSRFEDVWELLRTGDNTFSAVETNLPTPDYLRSHHNAGNPPPFASSEPMAPLPSLASPWYEEMRNAHMAPLKPKAVLQLAGFIRDVARERLDQLLPLGRFDLVRDYAGHVVANSICRLFGIDAQGAQGLLELVNEITRPAEDATVDFTLFFKKLNETIVPCIEARRAAGADGGNALIDGLVRYRMPDGRALSDKEIADQLVCVMIGGIESASKVTGQGLMELRRRPDQMAAVRADMETNVPIAVEEMVRHCAPAQYTFRTAHKDTAIAGTPIRAGQRVCAMIWSAAHDEREFDQPDEFVWNRRAPRMISFGLGQHHCVGKHLALLEVRIMVEEFLLRVRDFDVVEAEALRNPSYFQHGYISIPVVVRG